MINCCQMNSIRIIPISTGWKEITQTSIVLQRQSVISESTYKGFVFDPGIKWRICYCHAHHTWLRDRDVTWPRDQAHYRAKIPAQPSSCPMELPCAQPKTRKIGVAATCSSSGWEMFDLGTAQANSTEKYRPFCRRAPTSCKQFPASNSSPGSSRRHGLIFRRMCFTLVSAVRHAGRYSPLHHK